jgi:hypothetical protein
MNVTSGWDLSDIGWSLPRNVGSFLLQCNIKVSGFGGNPFFAGAAIN